jgi:6-phosphofructokinase (EC 2.7.1.11)
MPNHSLRVGVLTGGGDCPGLNAALRAVTKSLTLQHDAEVLGFRDGFRGLVDRTVEPLRYRDVSGILTRGGTILGASNKADPFNYLPRGGADVSAQVVKTYRTLDLDALVAIGGDGTMSIANRLTELDIDIVGVPKTIDNDLVGTDRHGRVRHRRQHRDRRPRSHPHDGPEPPPRHDRRDDGAVRGLDCASRRGGQRGGRDSPARD